jgi:hypothetical protein
MNKVKLFQYVSNGLEIFKRVRRYEIIFESALTKDKTFLILIPEGEKFEVKDADIIIEYLELFKKFNKNSEVTNE